LCFLYSKTRASEATRSFGGDFFAPTQNEHSAA
jgi:hypothetical protein